MRGQAAVEFALILPILLFMILGCVELALVIIEKADLDRRTATIAQWSADRPGQDWHAVANQIGLGPCDVTVDETHPGLVTAGATCWHQPIATRGLFDGIAISSTETAAVTP